MLTNNNLTFCPFYRKFDVQILYSFCKLLTKTIKIMKNPYEQVSQELSALPEKEVRRMLNICRMHYLDMSYVDYRRFVMSFCYRLIRHQEFCRRDFDRALQIGTKLVVPSYYKRQLRGAFVYKNRTEEDKYEKFITAKEFLELRMS